MGNSEDRLSGSADARAAIRAGDWTAPTPGLAPGYAQANVVILPEHQALDFLFFCLRNPGPCPLIDIVETGSTSPTRVADGADLRTDVPRYRLFSHGELVEESPTAEQWWRDDLVTFLLGCSFSFDYLLRSEGLPVRHVEEGCNVSMFITARRCESVGPYKAPLVVSMRPMSPAQSEQATTLTASRPGMHGAPVHIGDPSSLGIEDLSKPAFGDPVTVYEGEVPVFWACGVTTQLAIENAKPDVAITHSPGHMFITDLAISASREPGEPTQLTRQQTQG